MKKNLFIVDKNGYVISFVGANFETIFFKKPIFHQPCQDKSSCISPTQQVFVTKQPSFLTNTVTYFIKEYGIILQVARFTQ